MGVDSVLRLSHRALGAAANTLLWKPETAQSLENEIGTKSWH